MDGGRGLGGFRLALVWALAATVFGCSGKSDAGGDESDDGGGTGGTSGTSAGGTSAGGTSAGGTSAGGTSAGGTSAGGTTAGGVGGTGGSAGAGGSPGPSWLGLYLMIRNPDAAAGDAAGLQCPASSGIEWDIGAAVLSNDIVVDVLSPRPTDRGTPVPDGEEDTAVSCTVTPSGMVSVEGGGRDPMITPPNGVLNFTLGATASLRGGVNVTGLSLYTPITLALRTAPGFPPCTMSDVHEVTQGSFWGDLDCPALVDPSRPDVACHASGTIVIENCATQ
jgi:hypothetical protein